MGRKNKGTRGRNSSTGLTPPSEMQNTNMATVAYRVKFRSHNLLHKEMSQFMANNKIWTLR